MLKTRKKRKKKKKTDMSGHPLSLNGTLQIKRALLVPKTPKGRLSQGKVHRKSGCFLTLKDKFAIVDALSDHSMASLRSMTKSTNPMKEDYRGLGDCLAR